MNSQRSLLSGLSISAALATVVTAVMAWPVVLHPTQQIFGREILGRHPDAYTAIMQFGTGRADGTYFQPLTDGVGWLLGRVMPAVAAYNVVVLMTFPLAAMAAYALTRYLTRSHGAALVAALAFAFAPAHLAQASYHPHIAQTQWLALYVLALVALIDRLSVSRIAFAVAACAALVLSNFYGGLIGALMAPVILAAFWAIRSDADKNIWPFLGPALVVSAIAVAVGAWIVMYRPEIVAEGTTFGSALEEIAFYRGRWWAYVTPPIDHRWLRPLAERILYSHDVNLQLTELQLFLGYSLLLLALAALIFSIARWKSEPQWRIVPAALFVAIVAALVSLGPTSGTCDPTSLAPGCLFYRVAPVFRMYGRFGLVTQLMVSVAAGAGATLIARRSRNGRRLAAALLVVAAFEYWPLPARAHDVLPTSGHRWLAASPDAGRTLDCYPGRATETAIPWMMRRDVVFLGDAIPSCADPRLGQKLAGVQITQVLVRRSAAASKLPVPLPTGLTLVRAFPDADLYSVAQTPPAVVTVSSSGFFGYEHSGDDWWQWMSPAGTWIVANTTTMPRRVSLSLNLMPVGVPRHLTVTMDGVPTATLSLGMTAQDVTLGPWTLAPGRHELGFVADGDPVRPSDTEGSSDRRPLTVSFRNERWNDTP